LISGRGSNLQAIAEAIRHGRLDARIAVVVSNQADAPGLAHAHAAGIETIALPAGGFASRDAYDARLAGLLGERGVRLVCLAGFMRLVGPPLLEAFPDAVLNIHPSLLPAFPGLDAQRQALAHGVKVSGATVHFTDEGVDTGPIIVQAAVPVEPDDTEDTLAARVLTVEHRLYREAIRLFAEGRLEIVGRKVVITPGGQA
jgi:phosphoribosylglycinamide formyltransferase-1